VLTIFFHLITLHIYIYLNFLSPVNFSHNIAILCFQTIFTTPAHSKQSRCSYLVCSMDSNKLSRSLPTPNDLWPSDQAAQLHLYQQLPVLVWYGLRFRALGHPWAPLSEANDDPNLVALDTLPKRALCEAFPNLKKFNRELPGINQATPESLSQMDVDAFLFAIGWYFKLNFISWCLS